MKLNSLFHLSKRCKSIESNQLGLPSATLWSSINALFLPYCLSHNVCVGACMCARAQGWRRRGDWTQFSWELWLQPTVWLPHRGPSRRSPAAWAQMPGCSPLKWNLVLLIDKEGFFPPNNARLCEKCSMETVERRPRFDSPLSQGQCGQKLHKCPVPHRGHRPRPTRRGQYCTQPVPLRLNCQQQCAARACSNSSIAVQKCPLPA